MKNPFDYFDKIYCINLDNRKDRWEAAQKQFKKLDIDENIRRFSGVIPEGSEPSSVGCALSHLAIIEMSRQEDIDNVLVLEDDVSFINNPIEIMNTAIAQLQEFEWSLLYLGASVRGRALDPVSDNLVRIKACYATHAICYNRNVYKFILENMAPDKYCIDVWMRRFVQRRFVCLGINPIIATQTPDYSDIEKRFVNYDFIERNYAKGRYKFE